MKTAELTRPEIAVLAVTRVMAGAGAGLLLAGRLSPEVRKGVGWTLFLIGALSTIPIAANIIMKNCPRHAAP
ncbi:MAG: hypothetical protein ABFD62_17235 [Syntrophaceae bacterium]